MNKKQGIGIIIFLSLPTVVFAITSLSCRSLAYSENDMLMALKAMEYSLLTWICLIFIGISFMCIVFDEEPGYIVIEKKKEEKEEEE